MIGCHDTTASGRSGYLQFSRLASAPARSSSLALGSAAAGSSDEAVVRHVRAFGPLVRLELDLVEGGRMIEAHVARARFDGLALAKGRRVYVSPTQVRVFAVPS